MGGFTSGLSGQFELQNGCHIEMELGVDRVTEAFLREKHLPVPAPVKLLGLIDTGATATCIDTVYINQLSLKSRGYEKCRTAGGMRYAPVCIVRIRLALQSIPWEVDYHPCAAFNNLTSGGEGALIGLDVLRHFHFNLDGPRSGFQLLLPEVGAELPRRPLMEGSSYFDPARDCFKRHLAGDWQEYHPIHKVKPTWLGKLKNHFWGRP